MSADPPAPDPAHDESAPDPAHDESAPDPAHDVAPAPAIILVEPSLPENIGAAARAMMNFGLSDLRLVRPQRRFPHPRAEATAAGADAVLEAARLFDTLDAAIADLQRVYGTTAIPRDMVKRWLTPRAAADKLHAARAAGLATGLVFGPERTGLFNDDVALLDAIICIPTQADFSSLNLAQALVVIGYEWHMATHEGPGEDLATNKSPPAAKAGLVKFIDRLEQELDACGFLRVPDKRPSMVRNIRALFGRMDLTEQELRTLHGILTELVTRRTRPGGPPEPSE